MSYSVEEINRLIKNRRSVFPANYSEEIIDDKIVEQILENATWAPTHRITEPWHFTVFTGEGLSHLANFQAQLYKEKTFPDQFDVKTYNKLIAKPMQCSHVISIGMKRDESGVVPEIEEVEAVACAVQNMHLTATAYGVGAYWGTGGITYFEEAKDFFGLGDKDKLLGFFFLGIPKKELDTSSKRSDIKEKITWIRD